MRAAPLLVAFVATGCGRVGFGDVDGGVDATIDATTDAQTEGLLIDFSFDGDLVDQVNRSTASCVGACPTYAIDRHGSPTGSLRLDGTQCLRFKDFGAVHSESFTLAAWVLADELRDTSIVGKPISELDDFRNSFELWTRAEQAVFTVSLTPDGELPFSTGITVGTWHHLAGTFDAGTMTAYFDGVASATRSGTSTEYTSNDLFVGCDMDVGMLKSYVIGQIDDVRFYDRVLGPSEIAALAQ